MTTTTHDTETVSKIDELPPSVRRIIRWTVLAVVISLAGLALGGISLGVQAASVARESSRNTWDQAQATHVQCVSAARSRAVTIETSHDQYDAQSRQLDAQDRFVDLIEGIVGVVRSPEFVGEALARTTDERSRIADDRAQLEADRAAFDQARPPLDESACPQPPTGPRP